MSWDTPTYFGQSHSNPNPVGYWFDNPPIGGASHPEMTFSEVTPRGSMRLTPDEFYIPRGVILWPDGPGVWPDR